VLSIKAPPSYISKHKITQKISRCGKKTVAGCKVPVKMPGSQNIVDGFPDVF